MTSDPDADTADVIPDPETILIAARKGIDQVRTKAADYSFNELYDMYLGGELLIDPAYQRAFRWSEEKQSQFIESLILELPIPAIYVMEVQEGQYELIDGLQRFSSYLHFRGELVKDGERQPPLSLVGCDIVRELNNLTYTQLPTALQIRIKRMTVPLQILRKESDTKARYHMFKRLNRGGEVLSDQEVRNATIRLLGTAFNDFLRQVVQNDGFQTCTEIMTDADKEQMAREECALRFFAFKNDISNYSKLIRPFLDSYMEKVTEERVDFDYEEQRAAFDTTFAIFARTAAEQSFSSVGRNGSLTNQFSQSHFDMLTLGVQKRLCELDKLSLSSPEKLKKHLLSLKKSDEFLRSVGGGGKNYLRAYKRTIELVERTVDSWFVTA